MKPTWLLTAEHEIGVKEIKGGENARIIEYFTATSFHAKEDELPWCAAFVNWSLKQKNIVGTDSAAAASFINWGVALTSPREGCVCVIRQNNKGADKATGSTSGNHVGFFNRIDNGYIYLLGGNQSDSVKISGFNLASYEVIAMRWPEGVK